MSEDEQAGGKRHDLDEKQPQQAGGDDVAYFVDLPLGEAWGESITKGRTVELETRLHAWEEEAEHGERKGPFASVKLSGADVFWLAARTLAGSREGQAVTERAHQLSHARSNSVVSDISDLSLLNLSGANLRGANLAGAFLRWANLARANLVMANLAGAALFMVNLAGAFLSGANLAGADLNAANLAIASLDEANLAGAFLSGANLDVANLFMANLAGADLWTANLAGANLSGANLAGANLSGANLAGADLNAANLAGVDLRQATIDNRANLTNVVVSDTPHWYTALVKRVRHTRAHGPVSIADTHWNDVDVTVLDWSGLRRLGDEHGKLWWWRTRKESEQATRANVQLAKRLRDAGMNDDADRFSYRAQVCQRGVHLLRFRLGRWLFSWLLFVIAGYGYRPLRTLFWYLAVIFGFAFVYHAIGPGTGIPLPPLGSLVFSVTSFHGRGFFPGGSPGHSVTLDDPLTVMAAAEAVVGLFIEISFIATFTQRYFGK